MVWAGWGVSRVGGGDSWGTAVGPGAPGFSTVPGGPGAPSRTGPSETMVSPGVIPQHSIPLPLPLQPLRQQRRPSQGRSGQHQQQPLVNSKPATTTIDIQRVRTMRCVPLSRNGRTGHKVKFRNPKSEIRNGPQTCAGQNPKSEARNPKWTADMSRLNSSPASLQTRNRKGCVTIMPQELEEAKRFKKRKRPTAGKPWAW